MGIASTICLPNDPVGTAIISVRHWQVGNCSQILWRIVTVKGLGSVTTSHRPVFSLSESLKHVGDTGLWVTQTFSVFSAHLGHSTPLSIFPPPHSSSCPSPQASFSHPSLPFSLSFFPPLLTKLQRYLGRKFTIAGRRPGVTRWECRGRMCKETKTTAAQPVVSSGILVDSPREGEIQRGI